MAMFFTCGIQRTSQYWSCCDIIKALKDQRWLRKRLSKYWEARVENPGWQNIKDRSNDSVNKKVFWLLFNYQTWRSEGSQNAKKWFWDLCLGSQAFKDRSQLLTCKDSKQDNCCIHFQNSKHHSKTQRSSNNIRQHDDGNHQLLQESTFLSHVFLKWKVSIVCSCNSHSNIPYFSWILQIEFWRCPS